MERRISTDDEAFACNRQVSRLAPIQARKMIRKAIERDVPKQRIAAALDLGGIRRKVRRLDGVREEAVGSLRTKPCTAVACVALRQMKILPRIEAAERLVNASNRCLPPARDPQGNAAGAAGRVLQAEADQEDHAGGYGANGAGPGPPAGGHGLDPGRLRPGSAASACDQGPRAFVRGPGFRPHRLETDGILDREDPWIADLPAYESAPTPVRGVNPAPHRSVDGRGRAFPALSCGRSALRSSRRRRGANARPGARPIGLSKDDPGGPETRGHLPLERRR